MYNRYDYITPEILNSIEQKIVEATSNIKKYYEIEDYTPKNWSINERIYIDDIAHIENQIINMGKLIKSNKWIEDKIWEDGKLFYLSFQDFNRWLHNLDLCILYIKPIEPIEEGFYYEADILGEGDLIASKSIGDEIYYWKETNVSSGDNNGFLCKYNINTKKSTIVFSEVHKNDAEDYLGYTGVYFDESYLYLFCPHTYGATPSKKIYKVDLKTGIKTEFGDMPISGLYEATPIEYNGYFYFLGKKRFKYDTAPIYMRINKNDINDYQILEKLDVDLYGKVLKFVQVLNGIAYFYKISKPDYQYDSSPVEIYALDLERYINDEIVLSKVVENWLSPAYVMTEYNNIVYSDNSNVGNENDLSIYTTNFETLSQEKIIDYSSNIFEDNNPKSMIISQGDIYISTNNKLYKYIKE